MSLVARAPFQALDDTDPAVPGDPWVRVRYNYGQLLGADDFGTEQRAVVLRRRVHNALAHGSGVVVGLGVDKKAISTGEELLVAPGLAVDPVGREIWVDRTQCLDVTALHTTPLWGRLTADAAGVRTAHVVLRYGACLAGAIPAIAAGCRDADANPAYSRVQDAFRLCLEVEAPPDPHELVRPWHGFDVAPGDPADLRSKWLAWSLQDASKLDRIWHGEEDASVLLAVVTLRHDTGGAMEVTRVESVDVSVRALLPPVQALAELVTGHRLVGPDTGARLRVASVADPVVDGADLLVRVALTGAPHAATLGAVSLLALGATAWAPAAGVVVAVAGDGIDVRVPNPGAETTFQLRIVGDGAGPLLGDADRQPLDGWWEDPRSRNGRGRDVSHTFTWKP